MFDTQTSFLPTLSDIEALLKLKQTRNLADDNLFGGLRVNWGEFSHSYTLSTILSLLISKTFDVTCQILIIS